MSDTPTAMLDAPELARRASALSGEIERIVYVPGPGDVIGTWTHWRAGRDDPRNPAIGYSQQIYELARAIDARMLVVTVGEVPPDAGDEYVSFVHLARPSGRGLTYRRASLAYGLTVLRLAREFEADTLLVQSMLAYLWPFGRFAGPGRRLIFSLHNVLEPPKRRGGLLERMGHMATVRALRRAHGVIGVGPETARQIARATGLTAARVMEQIPQYADRHRRPAPEGRDRLPPRLLYVGRVETDKGVFMLLDAFRRLAAAHPEAQLDYIGGGGALETLRAAVASDDVGGRVRVLGPQPALDIYDAMAESGLVVCPTMSSFREGLAKPPIEAAFHAVPSLVSDVVPVAEIMGDGCAVFPADDTDALTAALDRLLGDPADLSRLGHLAHGAVDAVFDRDRSLAARCLQALEAPPP